MKKKKYSSFLQHRMQSQAMENDHLFLTKMEKMSADVCGRSYFAVPGERVAMKIWDALQSTADHLPIRPPDLQSVKDASRSAYGLGQATASSIGTVVAGEAARAGKLLYSGADKVRRSAPDLSPVSATASRVDRAVRVEGPQRIKDAVADGRVLEKAGCVAWKLADHVLAEFTRPFTGGIPVYKFAKEEWAKGRPSPTAVACGKDEELREMKQRMEWMEARMERMERSGPRSAVAGEAQMPDDVLRVFMMKGFKGVDFIDAQVIPNNTGKARKAL